MSPDAHIVLVERAETGPATTDYAELEPPLRDEILSRCHLLHAAPPRTG
jgi:hypothetical protein